MLDKIKRLGTDTAVYGVSTIVGRFLTFFLTPFYTHLLAPGELGVVATVYAYLAFLNIVYGYGMESAYMKYVATLEIGDRKQNFAVPFLSVCGTSLALSLIILAATGPVMGWARIPESHGTIVMWSAGILFFDAVALIPFACLRMERKAVRFAAIKLANIVINVGCNVFFLLRYHMGVEGIFISGAISSAATVVLVLPTILNHLTSRWSGSLYAALLRFGLPYVPAGLAAMMIQVIDRPILESLTSPAVVGVYQANYRLGIFMMLVVSMYDFAWRPFFLSHAADADAKPLFARILTYFILLMTALFLALSFFLADIVRLPLFWGHALIAPAYWAGLNIVPVVLLAYVFLGIYNNLVAGIYIQKKTKHLPLITFAGAAANVVVNYLLIPEFGMMGAAIATLVSYALMAAVLYVSVQRFYPVLYEWKRIARIIAAAGIVYLLFVFVDVGPYEAVWKAGLLLLFGLLVYWMHFFEPGELRGLALTLKGTQASQPGIDAPLEEP